jgi:hypothetical protein
MTTPDNAATAIPSQTHADSIIINLAIADKHPSYVAASYDILIARLSQYPGVLYTRQERTRYYLLISGIKYPADFAARIETTKTFKEAGWLRYAPPPGSDENPGSEGDPSYEGPLKDDHDPISL